MPAEVCAFWDEDEDGDGWVRVTRLHHQPATLDAATLARGVVCRPGKPPAAKAGWRAALWAEPATATVEWRIEYDAEYRMPAPEFLAMLPAATRVQARVRAKDDPILADFFALIDLLVADNAARGLHPGSRAVREGLGYLVSLGLMTAEQAAEITEP